MSAYPNLNALNLSLHKRGKLLWAETARAVMPSSITDIWEAEKPALIRLPTMLDGFVEGRKDVSPTRRAAGDTYMGERGSTTFARNRYSVPASFANRPVSVHIYPERLVVVPEGGVGCTHERIIERSHRQPGCINYD
jgi:hypothetical protein